MNIREFSIIHTPLDGATVRVTVDLEDVIEYLSDRLSKEFFLSEEALRKELLTRLNVYINEIPSQGKGLSYIEKNAIKATRALRTEITIPYII